MMLSYLHDKHVYVYKRCIFNSRFREEKFNNDEKINSIYALADNGIMMNGMM